WEQLEADCLMVYCFLHNARELRETGKSPAEGARAKVAEVKAGRGGVATRQDFTGPRLFMRVVGAGNRAYSGEWWFDADLFHRIGAAYARLYFAAADKKTAIRDVLRELVA